jgi:peptidyl-prolyl cis-trans isomerase C
MLPQKNKLAFTAIALVAMTMLAQPTLSQAKETPAGDEMVVATVNGNKILKKDVSMAMKTLQVKDADSEKVFPMIVDQIINEKLIDSETTKANIEKDPEFQKRLEATKAQLIKTAYIEKYLKDKLTDSAVKAEYEKFKSENKGKEEIHARHILVPSEEEAKQVIKDLDAGKKFVDLAKSRSSGPAAQNGGDLGYFTKEEMIPEFSNVAFNTKKGTYTSAPVKTQFGWHVIMVEDKRSRVVPAMKEVEVAIKNKLGQTALEKLVKDLRSKAEIVLYTAEGKPVTEEATKKN